MVQCRHTNCRFRARHMDGANFVFADGHAKWQAGPSWKPSQWTPTWVP